jgi:hypothetical protein
MSIASTGLSDGEKRPTAVRVPHACWMIGGDKPIGRNKLYRLIEDGEIESYLDGCTRMIIVESIDRRRARLLAEARHEDGRLKKFAPAEASAA